MSQIILGIDVGSYSVKIAQVRRTFKSFELIRFFERQIQHSDVVTPEEVTSAAIRGLIEDNLLKFDQVIVGIPGQHVSSRIITMPFSSRNKIDQTIEFELENYIPFAIEDIVVDYHIIKSLKESSKVIVLYAPKGQFVKYLTSVNNAGIDPQVVCVEGVELVNLVNLGMVPPEGLYALADVGHKKTTVTICKGKNLAYTRVVAVGGWHVTDAIAKKLNVPFDEAEKLKIEVGQVSAEEPQGLDDLSRGVHEAIRTVVDELVIHLRQTFFSHQDEEGEAVAGIYLSGGTSRLPGLDRYLSIKLKQNVAFLDCLEFHFSRLSASEVHLQLIPQALALALRGVAPAGLPDINFRRGEFAFKGDTQKIGGGIRRIGIALGLIFIMAVSYFGMRYYSLASRLADLNKDISALVLQAIPDANPKKLVTATSAVQFIKAKKSESGDRLAKLNAAVGSSTLDLLRDVSSNFPSKQDVKVDVEDFNYTNGHVKIAGKTNSFEAVDKIKTSLEKFGKFKDISTGNVRKGVKEEIKFDLAFDVQ